MKDKEKAAGGNHAAISISPTKYTQRPTINQAKQPKITITVVSGGGSEPPYTHVIKGTLARSLMHLKQCEMNGLTRIEALSKFGILSLTQHVSVFRHEYALDVECIRVSHKGRHGASKYGRYFLKTQIIIRVISGGLQCQI
ncbi:MAG: hypothetical protein SFW65_08455 [Alphaproteobacteria bacterium]|nr:hypothetical protein [Alphaproteobacteria bacterium]